MGVLTPVDPWPTEVDVPALLAQLRSLPQRVRRIQGVPSGPKVTLTFREYKAVRNHFLEPKKLHPVPGLR